MKTDLTDAVVDALASYRLVRLVQEDELPPMLAARTAVIERFGVDSLPFKLMDCPWCLGMWMAAGVVAVRAVSPRGWGVVARVLAFSAAAGLLAER